MSLNSLKNVLESPVTYFTPCSRVSIVNFEQVNADWDVTSFSLDWLIGQF